MNEEQAKLRLANLTYVTQQIKEQEYHCLPGISCSFSNLITY